MTEKQALLLLAKRDEAALAWIIERYAPYVGAVIAALSHDRLTPEDKEELAADVFVKLWRAKKKPEPGKLKAYLGRIARNSTLTRLRKQKILLPLDDETLWIDDSDQADLLSGKERDEAVRCAVQALPMPEREIFVRRYYYGQSAPEIANLLDLSPEAVRQRLSRGRKALRKALTGDDSTFGEEE